MRVGWRPYFGGLYDAYRRDELDDLRHRRDVDLTDQLVPWQAWLADRVAADTAAHYLAYVRTLMPVGAPSWRSAFTGAVVARWIATRTSLPQKRAPAAKRAACVLHCTKSISGSTRRKYLAAVQSFTKYLLEVGVLTSNPLRDVTAPRPSGPRCQFLELPDVLRLVDGAAQLLRAVYALAYGAGLEIDGILPRGRGRRPGDPTGARTGNQGVDARPAVRMARAGAPFELIARQLGHRDVTMVRRCMVGSSRIPRSATDGSRLPPRATRRNGRGL